MFPYKIVTEWSDRDQIFIARVGAIRNCAAHGDTAEDAAREVQIAAKLILEERASLGLKPPPPDGTADYSGNLNVRLPKSLHAELSERASTEGVSLNTLIIQILAQGLAPAKVVTKHVLPSVSTTGSTEKIFAKLDELTERFKLESLEGKISDLTRTIAKTEMVLKRSSVLFAKTKNAARPEKGPTAPKQKKDAHG